jgi:D-amino-acid dehydrogenase
VERKLKGGDRVSAAHVAVIGSGIVGTVSAIEALRCGLRVTIVDPGPSGGEQAASYGNAGWLSSHSVIPPALPGTWKKVPKLLSDPLGPLAVRWHYLPKALPWLAGYLWSGWTAAKVEATAWALRALLKDAPILHAQLATEAGVPALIERPGVLHVYQTRTAFEADSLAWSIRRKVGIEWLELSAEELHQREPELHRRYTFAVLVQEAGRCRDPGAYVAALGAHARALSRPAPRASRSRAGGFARYLPRLTKLSATVPSSPLARDRSPSAPRSATCCRSKRSEATT